MAEATFVPVHKGGQPCSYLALLDTLDADDRIAVADFVFNPSRAARLVARLLWSEFGIHLSHDTVSKHRRNECATCKLRKA